MGGLLAWGLLAAAGWLLLEAARSAPPARRQGLARGLAVLIAGAGLLTWPIVHRARVRPVDLDRRDAWLLNPAPAPGSPVRWEGDALVAELEAGSGRYAVFPVDWSGDRFEAEWDLTIEQLDLPGDSMPLNDDGRPRVRTFQEAAGIAIGLMDGTVSSLDDRDHVAGSALQACFSDDIRLRAADAGLLARTAAHDEPGTRELDPAFRPGAPVRPELGKRYHCRLAYRADTRIAVLSVSEGGRQIVSRRLEEPGELTSRLAWFGLSIRGDNRFDKPLDARKAENGYTRPRGRVRLEHLSYRQP